MSTSEPSMCLDRALRRLLYRPDASSRCDQPSLATDFCHGPVGTSCQRSHGPAKSSLTASSSSLPQAKNHPRAAATDACGLVTHALWVEAHQIQEYGHDPDRNGRDVVAVIPAGSCRGPIKAGPIHQDHLASNRTFVNEPLVTMHVNGSHLLELLEHGLELRHLLLQRDAHPRVSGMQFWVRPGRNNTRIFRPAVLHRGTCRWKSVESAALYSLVTVPSWVKQSRHLLREVPIHPVYFTDETSRSHNSSNTMTVAGAVWSYAQKVCRVEDPADVVAAILAGGRRWGESGDSRRRSGTGVTQASSSPVCAASQSPRKATTKTRHAHTANRTYHSRLATW